MKPLALAIVGCGGLVNTFILPALKSVKEFFVTALVDSGPAIADETAEQARLDCECFSSLEDLLAGAKNIGAAYVCTPNHTHAKISIALLRAGIPVLCEKPLAPSWSAAKKMAKVAEETGLPAMVAYMAKFNVYAAETVRIIKSGKLGAIELISTAFCYDGFESAKVSASAYEWRCRKASGGGALGDIGIYPVTMLRDMFGLKLRVKSAAISPLSDKYAPLTSVAELRAGNIPIHLYASIVCPKFLCHMEIIGSKGSLAVAHQWTQTPSGVIYVTYGDGLPTPVPLQERNCYTEEFRYFAKVVSGKQKVSPAFDFAGGAEDVNVLDKITRKAEGKK